MSMHAVDFTPLDAAGTFTTQMLNNNFSTFAQFTLANHERLSLLENTVTELASTLYDVSKAVGKVATKAPKKNSKLLILSVAVGAAYVGYQYAQEEIRKGRPNDLANKAAANVKTATEAGKDVSEAVKKNLKNNGSAQG